MIESWLVGPKVKFVDAPVGGSAVATVQALALTAAGIACVTADAVAGAIALRRPTSPTMRSRRRLGWLRLVGTGARSLALSHASDQPNLARCRSDHGYDTRSEG